MKTLWITVTLAIGLMVGTAQAGNSFCTTANGQETCNDTEQDIKARLCHSQTIGITKTFELGVSGGGMTAKAGLAATATVTQTGCITTDIPPGKCVYFEYKVECHSYEVPYWFVFTKVETECHTTGVTLKCKTLRGKDG